MTHEEKTTATSTESAHNHAQSIHRWEGHMADDVAGTYGTEPMAFLSATADELILSGSRGNYRLPRTSITRIGRGKLYPWFFAAVRIHHSVGNFPRDLQFKPLTGNWRQVRQALHSLGYPGA